MNKKSIYLSLLISFSCIVGMSLGALIKKSKIFILLLILHIVIYNRFVITNYIINNLLTMEDVKKGNVLGIAFSAILIFFYLFLQKKCFNNF